MSYITKGYTFGSTELVTNAKLHALVDSATINLTSLPSASGKVPSQNIWEIKSIATNSSVPNIGTGTAFRLYATTYCSIASFSNARVGQQFTLIAMQASFPAIIDDKGAFKLSANWNPASAKSSLTLIWDGTNFIEVCRVTV